MSKSQPSITMKDIAQIDNLYLLYGLLNSIDRKLEDLEVEEYDLKKYIKHLAEYDKDPDGFTEQNKNDLDFVEFLLENRQNFSEELHKNHQQQQQNDALITQFYDYWNPNNALLQEFLINTTKSISTIDPQDPNAEYKRAIKTQTMASISRLIGKIKEPDAQDKINTIRYALPTFLEPVAYCNLPSLRRQEQQRDINKQRQSIMRDKWYAVSHPIIPKQKRTKAYTHDDFLNDFLINALLKPDTKQLTEYDIAKIRITVLMFALNNIQHYLIPKQQDFTEIQTIAMQCFNRELKEVSKRYSACMQNQETMKYYINSNESFLDAAYKDFFECSRTDTKTIINKIEKGVEQDKKLVDPSTDVKKYINDMLYISYREELPYLFRCLGDLLPSKTKRLFISLSSRFNKESLTRLDDELFYELAFVGRDLGYPNPVLEYACAKIAQNYINKNLHNTAMDMAKTLKESKPHIKKSLQIHEAFAPSKQLIEFARKTYAEFTK